MRTRTPAFALPCWDTRTVRTCVRPTKSDFGDTATAVQYVGGFTGGFGGTSGPLTTTEADAVLFAVFVSGSLATVVAVFVSVPVEVAVVTSVIVTDDPTGMVPSWQLTSTPPVQDPCEVETETKLVPAGSGSPTVTPVAVLGPLFETTIVQVTVLPRVAGFGVADFVIWTSTFGAGGGGGGGGGGAALVLVSVHVA